MCAWKIRTILLYATYCKQHDSKERFSFVTILIDLYIPM